MFIVTVTRLDPMEDNDFLGYWANGAVVSADLVEVLPPTRLEKIAADALVKELDQKGYCCDAVPVGI